MSNPAVADQFLAERAANLARLRADYKYVVDREDGTYVAIYPLLFHWTMIVGAIDDPYYDDRWCYATEDKAMTAYCEWAARDYAGEPNGWHRHPNTGRRRTNGDPATEYVAH